MIVAVGARAKRMDMECHFNLLITCVSGFPSGIVDSTDYSVNLTAFTTSGTRKPKDPLRQAAAQCEFGQRRINMFDRSLQTRCHSPLFDRPHVVPPCASVP